MSFTSIPFLWFLAAFLTIYGLCPATYRRYLLLAGSVVFMWMGSLTAALWALGFVAANYLLGNFIQRSSERKLVMGMAVAINAMFLATAKLADMSVTGLSFYLFSFMAYQVEVYRGTVQAELDPIRFANYGFFFPKFTQGPITRYSEMAGQLDKPRITMAAIQKGLEDFTLGFVLKILVSDRLGILFGGNYDDLLSVGYELISTDLAWLGAVVTSLHIYIEWVAYMYMALGLAGMLGFKLPQNFNFPFIARTVGDYYRRWHMTLTRWFKDFVYIPLGGSRKGLSKTIVNVLFVWLLTSLWHGNGLAPKYMIWGILVGVAVILDPLFYDWLTKRYSRKPGLGLRLAGHLPLLALLLISWLILREPAQGFNFIIWGMSIGLLIVLERLWKTFVVDRFRLGEKFGEDNLLGKIWKFVMSALAHFWVVVTMVLSWVVFTIKDFDLLKLYFSRLFPATGASAGFIENDFSLRWDKLCIYVIIAVLFCFPLVDRGIRLIKRSRLGSWILSAILSGLFWYAVYILIVDGSNPMGYAAF
jgi:alginate O-acetyltransferase complex protein AlgI